MSGLPKKYARMGFAKGWKAYNKSKGKKTRSVNTMARKRGRKVKRRRSRAKGFFKRVGRKATSDTNLFQPDAMIYGALRGKMSQMLAPITAKIPIVGTASDEVAVGIFDWFIAKRSSGMVKRIAIKGLVAENVFAGADIGKRIFGGQSNVGEGIDVGGWS